MEPRSEKLVVDNDSLALEQVIHAAWRHRRFTCVFGFGDNARTCDVRSTMSETDDNCVIVVRDVTDRDRIFEMHREVQVSSIERLKDEDANRFCRHEIKNGVLATLSQITALKSVVWKGADPAQIHQMLVSMQAGLNQTLETVLSTAMARDVLHGNYVLRTAPCRIDEAMSAGLGVSADAKIKSRFPVTTRPAALPIVDVDQRLLTLVHRNAVLNACKYGSLDGIVATEIELEDHVLTIRVINEPGVGHEELMSRPDAAAAVFAKGTRLHMGHAEADKDALARVSKGDGGWIMKKCADSMQGECSIRFEPTRTVFELTCPAPERLDMQHLNSIDLSDHVWAIGIDDCEFQRMVLTFIFKQLGVPEHCVTILGATDDEMKATCDRIVAACNALPPDGFLLVIVDENLDLAWPSHDTVSGSSAIKRALSRLAPDVERRVFALVRSGQDSQKDLELYFERAHGFLSKSASGQPDRDTVLDKWVRRFGLKSVTPKVPKVSPSGVVGGGEDTKEFLMARELGRLTRLLDKSIDTMRWGELLKLLHRIKGVLQSTRVMGTREEADAITAIIDTLRLMQ